MKIWRVFSFLAIVIILLVLGTGTVLAQEEPPDEDPEGEGIGKNPVAVYLAEYFSKYFGENDDYYSIIRGYQESGFGLGNISKAIYLQSEVGGDIETILNDAQDMGWGEYYKSLGMHPGGGHGLGWMFKKFGKKEKPEHGKPEWAGPPAHANNDKDKNSE